MSASIGAALAEGGEHTPETLLRDADAAMYRAKQTGSTAELFDERLRAEAKARIELEADLHLALEREELLLFYQPLVSIEFGQMIGVEALLRWQRPGALLVRELGIEIALDDFGTGYSSLAHLKHFPVNTIKVDRSFVSGLATDRSDCSIVAAVISLAHGLGLRAVAEGVETEEQLGDLRVLHCDFAQGFHFSRPQPPELIERLFAPEADRSRRPASVS